ncbi:MAG: ABC transporter ATP-binding protein [Eubacteriaceae bacterium]|nr:ABC transporter ATP-binding protein [Eubacteriaceae bacterium]
MKPLVTFRNLSKKYFTMTAETLAIEGFSLEIFEGEFIALVGPSGCGKSTILTIMAGLIAPSSGTCEFDPTRTITKGYMLQRDHLFGWRTILSNALLGLEIKKEHTSENIEYVKELLCTYGLGDFMYHYPYQLSGGMRQRAALIRTLALRPDILLLDEPFSALDYQTRISVGDDIASIIRKEKRTAVLVTHDLGEAISYADRVVVLTARPGAVKKIYNIELDCVEKTRVERQNSPGFTEYYNNIWEDLDVHV